MLLVFLVDVTNQTLEMTWDGMVTYPDTENEDGETIPGDTAEAQSAVLSVTAEGADEPLALQMIYEVVFAAMQDDQDLAVVLTNRAYNQGIPLNDLRDRSRDALVAKILKVKPSTKDCDELIAIAQTVAILGEGLLG